MNARGFLLGAIGTVCALLGLRGQPAEATPLYSVSAVNACDTCHIEPSGWAQPELKDRRCTLDCSGCHVSPGGGGMRTPSGAYYGREELPTFGTRPGRFTDPAAYRPDGHPVEGRFRIGEGFAGWWPGPIPAGTIPDRYGQIAPDPKVAVGGDARFMGYVPLGEDADDPAFFPMQASLELMGRPSRHLVLYTNLGLAGHKRSEGVDPLDYLAVRELFVKVDRLPWNLYVRGGRFAPQYGWRLPDHTSFIRRELGFDQNRQVWGVEAGLNPNYPFANVALFAQGISLRTSAGDATWAGDTGDAGYGASLTAGVRELGWQAGGSLHVLRRPEGDDELLAGPMWAVNLYPVSYLGELDLRRATGDDGGATNSLVAYNEVDWRILRGLIGKLKFDWIDDDIRVKDDHRNRVTASAEWHPYTYSEIELQYRRNYQGGSAALIGSALTGQEIILMLHGWY